jgi:surfeit locus 1 family protein
MNLSRTQSVDFPALSVALAVKLEPFLVLLDDGMANGYDRQWVLPVADDGKHQAYAVQWFTMAACIPLLLAYRARRTRSTSTKTS